MSGNLTQSGKIPRSGYKKAPPGSTFVGVLPITSRLRELRNSNLALMLVAGAIAVFVVLAALAWVLTGDNGGSDTAPTVPPTESTIAKETATVSPDVTKELPDADEVPVPPETPPPLVTSTTVAPTVPTVTEPTPATTDAPTETPSEAVFFNSSVLVRAQGTAGGELLELWLNEALAATFEIDTDENNYVHSPGTLAVESLELRFVNDSVDRDVRIDYVEVGGTRLESEDPSTRSQGTFATGTGCDEGNKESEWLHCGGWMRFDVPSDTVTAPIPTFDTAWELPTFATDAEIGPYFDHLTDAGFDGVFLSLLNHTYNRHRGSNGAGQLQSSVTDGNIVVNPDHLRRTRGILDEAAARDLQVGFVPIWGNAYVNEDWIAGQCNGGTLTVANAEQLGRQIGTEIGDHESIAFWILGGDNQCQIDGTFEDVQIWRNLAVGLRSAGITAPFTYHTPAGNSTSNYRLLANFANESWVDFLFPQTGHCDGGTMITDAVQRLHDDFAKPVFAAETRYFEGGSDNWCRNTSSENRVDAEDVRADVEAALNGGVIGIAYGDWNRWNWCQPTDSGRMPYDNPCGGGGLSTTYDTTGERTFLETVG